MPYKTLTQLNTAFHSLVVAHPQHATEEVVGTSYLGKNIMAYSFGSPTGGYVMFEACIHGREVLNGELMLQYATWLFNGSAEANRILAGNWTTIIPVLNVDGYVGDAAGTRKNKHDYTVNIGGTNYTGPVDLNRNFETGFKGASASSDVSCPGNPASLVPICYNYQGPDKLSESESLAMHNYQLSKKPKWYVQMHTGTTNIYYRTGDSHVLGILNSFLAQDPVGQDGVTYVLNPQSSGGAMSFDDAHTAGINAILWEINPIENNDTGGPDVSTVATTWFPRFLPMAKLVSADAAGPVPPPPPSGLAVPLLIAGIAIPLFAYWFLIRR